jgi:hypothetical protein
MPLTRFLRQPVFVSVCALLCGCGYGHLQSAKTTPKGHLDAVLGGGVTYNKTIKERDFSITNLPLMVNARLGILDQMDIGLRMYMMAGLMADVKYNFMPHKHPLAVSVQGGVGMAKDIISEGVKEAWNLQLPVFAHLSYTVKNIFTPYASLGYSIFWIFGRKGPDPNMDYVDQKGYGDGMLMAGAGFEVRFNDHFSMALEYNYWHPLQDDPGDKFSFVPNHIVVLGIMVRTRIFGSEPRVPETRPELPPPPPPPPPSRPPPSRPPPKKLKPKPPVVHTQLF